MKTKTMLIILALMLCGMAQAASPVKAQVDTMAVTTTYMVSPLKVTVALPESYLQPGDTAHYPVVYLLNGHGGSYRTWPSITPVADIATRFGVIIVCPDGRNSWYWDSPVDKSMQMESFMLNDLVPTIDRTFRTRASREGRAITGLSMGGHGGLWLGIRHSDVFGSAGSMSGGVNIIPFPKNWHMADRLGSYVDNPRRWEEHTVINLVDDLKPGQLNIIFDCGTEDFFYKVNCDLDRALNLRGIPHVYITSPGAHNAAYWSRAIYPQMEFFHSIFYPGSK